MAHSKIESARPLKPDVTVDDVNRLLDVGRMLLSVLSPEEVQQLQQILTNRDVEGLFPTMDHPQEKEIGNAGVT